MATPVQQANLVVELLVQRGLNVIHVDEETGTMNALTKEVIEPPLLSGIEVAHGNRRWWAAHLALTNPRMILPNDLTNRRDAHFYWAYDSVMKPTEMRFVIRDPRNPTNAQVMEDVARRDNILHETTLPAIYKNYKAMEVRILKLEDMWTKAPELVFRPEEDDIVICSHNRMNAPPEPLYREAEEDRHDKEQEEGLKRYKEIEAGKNRLDVLILEYLKKTDVRLLEIERQQSEVAKLWAANGILKEQMQLICNHLKIKMPDPSKPAPPKAKATPPGKLPVKMKSPEASKEAPL